MSNFNRISKSGIKIESFSIMTQTPSSQLDRVEGELSNNKIFSIKGSKAVKIMDNGLETSSCFLHVL